MKLEQYIEILLDEEGLTIEDVASRADIKKEVLEYQLSNNLLSADNLMKMACVMNLNLTTIKEVLYSDYITLSDKLNNVQFLKEFKNMDIHKDVVKCVCDVYAEFGEEVAIGLKQVVVKMVDIEAECVAHLDEFGEVSELSSSDTESIKDKISNAITMYTSIVSEGITAPFVGEYLKNSLMKIQDLSNIFSNKEYILLEKQIYNSEDIPLSD